MTEQEHRWRHVPDGWLPCPSCGVVVEVVDPDNIDVIQLQGAPFRYQEPESGIIRQGAEVVEMPVLRCGPCAQIRAAAEDLMRAYPVIRSNIGDSGIAAYRAEMMLVALDAAGVRDERRIDLHTGTAKEFGRSLEYLVSAGAGACWLTHARARGKVAAVLLTAPSSTRWGHLTGPARRALNEASVQLHRARTERPTPVVALDERGKPTGCTLCGVGTWAALPSLADRV